MARPPISSSWGVSAGNGAGAPLKPQILLRYEENDQTLASIAVDLPGLALNTVAGDLVDLQLEVDRAARQVAGKTRFQTNGVWSAWQAVGATPVSLVANGALERTLNGQNQLFQPSLEVLYRVNSGGDAVAASDGGPIWAADTPTTPSAQLVSAGSNFVFGTATSIALSSTVPAGTPASLFQNERWDEAGESPWPTRLQWQRARRWRSASTWQRTTPSMVLRGRAPSR